MAEEKKRSISVLIPTDNYTELAKHYIPQLCAHLEECGDDIASYEIVVTEPTDTESERSEETPLPNVRLIHTKQGITEVENLNHALFAASKNYVVIFAKNILPAHNYFKEIFKLFNIVPSLFGASGNTLMSGNTLNINGIKTLDPAKKGINIICQSSKSANPTYTLVLSSTNMVIDRRYLCLMGGFCELFSQVNDTQNEACIRAWRAGRKCLYLSVANCKLMTTEDSNSAKLVSNTISSIYGNLLTNYLHLSRFDLIVFISKTLFRLTTLKFSKTATREEKAAYKKYFEDAQGRIRQKYWLQKQHNEPFKKIAKGFFSGKPIEITNTKH